jgi:membrane fusion protein (multidrug efflux system)
MLRKILIRVVPGVLLLLFVGAGVWYWVHIHTFVSTDDAYVSGYIGVISARVPGRVAAVAVDNNQLVQPGQVLLTLEPQDYQSAVAQAEGNLGRLRQEMAANYVQVAAARAKLAEAEANFKLAGADQTRYSALYQRRTVPKQTLDNVETRYRVNQAQVDRYKRELQQTLVAIGGSTELPIDEQPVIKQAQAQLEQARLNLDYTRVTAKITGYVTRRQVEAGNWVQPGQPLMTVVPLETAQLWIQANYKETELTHVYLGQPAKVEVDTYPGARFQGPGGLHHGRHRGGLFAAAAGERHRQLG